MRRARDRGVVLVWAIAALGVLTALGVGIGRLTLGTQDAFWQLAARAHFWVRTLEVDFSRLDIEAGEVNAEASGPARLSGTRTSGEPETGERQVRFTLTRTDSDWLIDSVKVKPRSDDE